MELQTLKVTTREARGKGAAHRLRLAGEVPGIVYGLGHEPLSFKTDLREFEHLVHGRQGEHAIVQLDVAEKPDLNGPALLKTVQHHPVSGAILHADFLRISLDDVITTMVPIHLSEHCAGLVEGGVLDHQLREVEVECRALDVPDAIFADISELNIGDSLHVGELVAPPNVKIVTESERAIVAVHAPRVLKAAEEELAEEGEEEEEGAPEEAGEETAPEEG